MKPICTAVCPIKLWMSPISERLVSFLVFNYSNGKNCCSFSAAHLWEVCLHHPHTFPLGSWRPQKDAQSLIVSRPSKFSSFRLSYALQFPNHFGYLADLLLNTTFLAVVQSRKLDVVLQMWSQVLNRSNICFPESADHTLASTKQHTAGLLHHKGTLLLYIHFEVYPNPQAPHQDFVASQPQIIWVDGVFPIPYVGLCTHLYQTL